MNNIYPVPFTRVNESWNNTGVFNSNPSQPYRDPMITGTPVDWIYKKEQPFCDFYDNVAIDIVAETVYNYPSAQITEKTLRPLLQKRMFLIVGPAGSLALLKHIGFLTFDPYINESYDLIKNPHERMKAILDEVDRIANLSLDTVNEYMLECNDRIEHNRAHLLDEINAMPKRYDKLLEEL